MSEIIRVDPIDPDPDALEYAAGVLRRGGLVAFPTETVYGLGANAFDEKAVRRIFEVKGRPPDNPLIVHICSVDQLDELVRDIPKSVQPFIERLWPGPFTVVLEKRDSVPGVVTAGLDTVAVRMPSHPVARLLIELSGVPVAAPSANLSGKPSPTTFEHVLEDLHGKVEVLIDGGETPFGIESTVMDFTKDPPVLLRPGPLTVEQLSEIGRIIVPEHVRYGSSVDRPASPGMKYRHYAPEKPLILVENPEKMKEVLRKFDSPIIVCPKESARKYAGMNVLVIGELEKPYSIAKNLFGVLREADRVEGEVIIVEGLPERGILFSVMNRLRKASGGRVVR